MAASVNCVMSDSTEASCFMEKHTILTDSVSGTVSIVCPIVFSNLKGVILFSLNLRKSPVQLRGIYF